MSENNKLNWLELNGVRYGLGKSIYAELDMSLERFVELLGRDFYCPTLLSAPTSSTVTYVDTDDDTHTFQIGQPCRWKEDGSWRLAVCLDNTGSASQWYVLPVKVSELTNDAGYLTEHQDISGLATKEELNKKVDKVEGKQLSTEDFTTLLKNKLDGLSNYDDTEISQAVSKLRADLDALVSGDTTTAIKTFNEVIAFLDGISDKEDLSGILASIEQQIAAKQDTIADLATIREGASLGKTALQAVPEGYATESYVTNALDVAITNKADKTEIPTKVSQLENDANYIADDVLPSNGVYAVDASGNLIDYNTADSSCLGVALVQGEHKFMIAKSNATDGTNTTLYWTKSYSNLSLTNYSKVDGTNDDGYLPKPDGTFGGTTHLSDDFTTWTAGALSDFNGKANTAVIAEASSDARDMCTVLNTFNTSDSFKDWYVPACGQLALMYLNMTEINAALAKIGGTALYAGYYWSSSEYSSYGAWRVGFDYGDVGGDVCGDVGYSGKNMGYRVRFVRDISFSSLKERVSKLESNKQDKLVSGTNIKTINGQDILGEGDIEIESNSEANVGAVDTDDFVEEPDLAKYLTTKPQSFTDEEKQQVKDNLGINAEDFDLSDYATKEELKGKEDKKVLIDHGADDTTYALTPNVFHKWYDVASLSLTLAEPSDSTVYNEYMFEFISGQTAAVLTLPDTVKWVSTPSIDSKKTYQVSIVNNIGLIAASEPTLMYFTIPSFGVKYYAKNGMTWEDFVNSEYNTNEIFTITILGVMFGKTNLVICNNTPVNVTDKIGPFIEYHVQDGSN